MLTDRLGGRIAFTVLMFFVAAPVALVPVTTGYKNLLTVAFFLGMAGSSFAVGVGYVSRWFSLESQGSALGVYGLLGACGGRRVRVPRGVLGDVGHFAGLDRGVRCLRQKCHRSGPPQRCIGDDRRARTRASGLGARRFLL